MCCRVFKKSFCVFPVNFSCNLDCLSKFQLFTLKRNLRNFEKKIEFFLTANNLRTANQKIPKLGGNECQLSYQLPKNLMDFSDNFRNIKNFVQVDHIEKIMKSRLNFSFCRSKKTPAVGKIL